MKQNRTVEVAFCLVLALVAAIGTFYAFANVGDERRIVENGGGKINVVGAKGESLMCTKIQLVDIDGRTTLTIQAGPPATLEIKDSNGKIKVIDLAKLASNRWLQLPPE